MYIVLIFFKTGDEYVEERDGRRDEYTPGVVYNVTLGKLRKNSNEKERGRGRESGSNLPNYEKKPTHIDSSHLFSFNFFHD